MKKGSKRLHPDVRIGHVHLKVADLDRALSFYRDVLGFKLTRSYGQQAAFLSAGGYHHHVGLNTWGARGEPRHLQAPPACIMWQSSNQPELNWQMRCVDYAKPGSHWRGLPITA